MNYRKQVMGNFSERTYILERLYESDFFFDFLVFFFFFLSSSSEDDELKSEEEAGDDDDEDRIFAVLLEPVRRGAEE